MIVGRSNVGKSTLYNRLLGKKEAITGEEYGLTRDYQAQRCILNDIEFNLIDTAGYNVKKGELSKRINDTIKDQVMKKKMEYNLCTLQMHQVKGFLLIFKEVDYWSMGEM